MKLAARLVLMAACLAAGPALANDSSAQLDGGGLVLVKTDDITMQREDLTLSLNEVRVRYEMRNDTGKPVTLRVAFPMPELPHDTPGGWASSAGYNIALHETPTDPNFMHFRVKADGREIVPEVEIKAVLPGGRDVAAALREIGGLPLLMSPAVFEPKEHRFTEETLRRLKEVGALDDSDAKWFRMQWTVYITLHWMQTFAPGVTVVEHSYPTVIGGGLITVSDEGRLIGGSAIVNDADSDIGRAYCVDAETVAAVRAAVRERRQFGVTGLDYILQTARNWRGPIGTFHLTLDTALPPLGDAGKGPPKSRMQFTSLCTGLKLRPTGPNRFEATVQNYVPQEDLRVAVIIEQFF